MPGELVVPPHETLLSRVEANTAGKDIETQAAPVTPETPRGGLMERIDEVAKARGAELAPELSAIDEVAEVGQEIDQIPVEKLLELQQRIDSIPIELGAQEYQYQVKKTMANFIREVSSNQPSEPSPSAELFR